MFHEDPRYYVEGDGHNFFHRVFYSATRPLITQSDSGHKRINASMLLGYLGASALTTAYYPTVDHGFGNESKAFATSLATSILNDELHEFGGDLIRRIRRNK